MLHPLNMNALDVKEFRKKYGLTQSALAKKLGVDIKTVQNWEAGKTIPTTKYEIFRKLEIELSTLKIAAHTVNSGIGVQQNNENGDNYQGDGMTVHKGDDDLRAQIKKKDEQIDRLLRIIEKMQGI